MYIIRTDERWRTRKVANVQGKVDWNDGEKTKEESDDHLTLSDNSDENLKVLL